MHLLGNLLIELMFIIQKHVGYLLNGTSLIDSFYRSPLFMRATMVSTMLTIGLFPHFLVLNW